MDRYSPSRRRTRSLTLPTIARAKVKAGRRVNVVSVAVALIYGDSSCRKLSCPEMWLRSNICNLGGEQFDLFKSRIWIIKSPQR